MINYMLVLVYMYKGILFLFLFFCLHNTVKRFLSVIYMILKDKYSRIFIFLLKIRTSSQEILNNSNNY